MFKTILKHYIIIYSFDFKMFLKAIILYGSHAKLQTYPRHIANVTEGDTLVQVGLCENVPHHLACYLLGHETHGKFSNDVCQSRGRREFDIELGQQGQLLLG